MHLALEQQIRNAVLAVQLRNSCLNINVSLNVLLVKQALMVSALVMLLLTFIECHDACLECDGLGKLNCLSCHSDSYLFMTECVFECPEGTYADEVLRICESCPSPCAVCDSPMSCSKCSKSYYLSDDQCVEKVDCPEGTYPNTETNICEKCYEDCLSCIGPNKEQCTDCDEDFMEILDAYGTCTPIVCTEQQYANASSCLDCDSLCATCDSSGGCTQCKSGLIPLIQNDTLLQCQSCPKGYQYSASKRCEGKSF